MCRSTAVPPRGGVRTCRRFGASQGVFAVNGVTVVLLRWVMTGCSASAVLPLQLVWIVGYTSLHGAV